MNFGLIIVGDEILSGKRVDKHMPKVIELLNSRGLQLEYADYVGDSRERITRTLERAFASADTVFSCGGIGATPDDHTRQCAADAAGVALQLHPDAERVIRARFVDDPKGVTPQRLAMGEFPVGSRIIPNPYNRIPGFSVRHHHFLPGFPEMAWPMMAWVLDHLYADRHRAASSVAERSIVVREAGESQLIDLMKACQARFPGIKVFCLPRVQPERLIELGVRGEAEAVPAAIGELQTGVSALGFPWTEGPAPA